MKTALTIASFALVFTGVSGCGDDAPPTDASVEDFCGHYDDFIAEIGELGEDAEASELIEALKSVSEDMRETGTPEDIPDDAREGWENSLDAIKGLPDDATEEDLDELEQNLSESEQKNDDAFDEYQSETCDQG